MRETREEYRALGRVGGHDFVWGDQENLSTFCWKNP